MKISVIGTGAYGLAISHSLAKKNNQISMWTENENLVSEFQKTGNLFSILPITLSNNLSITTDLKENLKNTKLIYIVTASKYIENICREIKPYYTSKIPICIASKGIDDKSNELLSDLVKNILNTSNIAVISGPTFAIDMANDEPVALAIGSKSIKAKNMVLKTLPNDSLKLRPTKDIIGIQLCGAIKNVIAIAAGILKGLGYSESTQAFLINESLHDIKHIIYYLGGNPKTILSFAGIGDLMLTCTSTKSRNYSFGYIIGNTNDIKQIKNYLKNNTVEGYYTLDTVYKLLKSKNINIELITTIYNIVYNYESPNSLANLLITKK